MAFLALQMVGLTWIQVDSEAHFSCTQPLAIPGYTNLLCRNRWSRLIIRRSDDYGQTWRILKDFGPLQDSFYNDIAPYGDGYICGDLSRLYVQTDTGMFVSTDRGVTWTYDGGPTYINNFSSDRFYSSKGVTIAGLTFSYGGFGGIDEDGGLWEEIWPQAGVAEQESYSNTLSIFPNPAANSITVESVAGPISILDPLGRSYAVPMNGNALDVSSLPSGVYFVSDGVSRTKLVKE